jgi:hypothetical protein
LWELDVGARTLHLSENWLRIAGAAAGGPVIDLYDYLELVHPDDRGGVR